MSQTQVSVTGGLVEGRVADGVRTFLSLPYAAPVTDARRFRAPEPVEAWSGMRDATVRGPCAPQSPMPPFEEVDLDAMAAPLTPVGPDYLTLNVWAPAEPTGKRPVMIWIHGGGFVNGSKDVPLYDGSSFARNGVVCVAINYRMGIEGFLPIADAPTNLGLRDMLAAFRWVQDNIAAFGGDPGNVTLFGESGGAYCIGALMTSPLSKGLFRRAICQSGHADPARDPALMRGLAARIARRARISCDRAGFTSLSAEALLPVQEWVLKPNLFWDMKEKDGRDQSFGITRFLPVHGDDVLPLPGMKALEAGAGAEIDLLIGTTRDEANLFFAPMGGLKKINGFIARFFLGKVMRNGRQALAAYGLGQPGVRPGVALSRAVTDLMFRWPTRQMAARHRGRSHVYEFDWSSPALGGQLGAAHAIDIPFAFNTLAVATGDRGLLGPAPPQALADSIHALWIRFATDGILPWPAYEPESRLVYSLTREIAEPEAVMPAAAFLP